MILSAHQPNFIPWTGYFLKVALSDIHIILDNVEYSKNGWTNRNKIQLSLESYITLPVRKKDTGLLISGVNLAENYKTAINKTRKTLRQFYGKSPGFEFIDSVFFDVIDLDTASLFNINYYILTRFLDFLEIDTPLILMSNIETNKELKGTDLLVSICSKNSCTQYLSGLGAKNYLDESKFAHSFIDVIWFNQVDHILNKFNVSGNSIIELIFNHGDKSKDIITQMINEVSL